MNLVYFKDLPRSRLSGWRLFIDYEGTLAEAGSGRVDDDSLKAVEELARASNEIYISTNITTIDERLIKIGAQQFTLTLPKPAVSHELMVLAQKGDRPVMMIGDSLRRDGELAQRLGIPFMPVLTLGSSRSTPFPKDWGCPAPFLEASERVVSIFTAPHAWLWSHIALLGPSTTALRLYSNDLIKAFHEIGVKVRVNPERHEQEGIGLVIGDSTHLTQALEAKKQGFLSSLIIGPGGAGSIEETQRLCEDSAIDAIVVESEAAKTVLVEKDQYFSRVTVIERGIPDPGERRSEAAEQGVFLLYAHDAPEKLFKSLMGILWQHKLPLILLVKNSFPRDTTLTTRIRGARALITLNATGVDIESRIAWLSGVPTLSWREPIPPECGRTFTDEIDFESVLIEFLKQEKTFTPRAYALKNCSAHIMAAKFLALTAGSLS